MYATRLVTWKAKNRYQVYFKCGMKNRRIGAAGVISPLHPSKQKEPKTKPKKAQKEEKDRARTHSSGVLLIL